MSESPFACHDRARPVGPILGNVSVVQPFLPAIDTVAAHCDGRLRQTPPQTYEWTEADGLLPEFAAGKQECTLCIMPGLDRYEA
jgi:hypothetical protein